MERLTTAYGELSRARTLIQDLAEMAGRYRSEPFYEIKQFINAADSHSPAVGSKWTVRMIRDPDDQVHYVFGDVVNNLRSALDHALLTLVESGGNLSDEDRARVQFPIEDNGKRFRSRIADVKHRLPPEICMQLREMQPYVGAPEWRYLRSIRDYSNQDKHRTVAVVTYSTANVDIEGPGAEQVTWLRRGPVALIDAATVGVAKWPRSVQPSKLQSVTQIRMTESVLSPAGLEEPLPLSVEMMFEAALLAVNIVLKDKINGADAAMLTSLDEIRDRRLANILLTLGSAEEVAAIYEANNMEVPTTIADLLPAIGANL